MEVYLGRAVLLILSLVSCMAVMDVLYAIVSSVKQNTEKIIKSTERKKRHQESRRSKDRGATARPQGRASRLNIQKTVLYCVMVVDSKIIS